MDSVLASNIEKALDEVRPYLHSHGGDLDVIEVKDRKLYVKFKGACIGCPISLYTLKMGVEERVKQYTNEIEEVIAIND